MTDAHTISIAVDSSKGIAGLNALRQAISATSRELSAFGGNTAGFSQLAAQLNATSSAFQNLAKSIAALSAASSRLGSLNVNSFSNLQRGATRAGVAIHALGGSFGLTTQAAGLLAAAVGGMSLAKFSADVQSTGNSLLSFKIAIDSVATSSRESTDALKFIRETASTIGTPLDAATESFKTLYSSMRALGRNPDEIMKVFRGFSVALGALHVSAQDQRMAWREISETYSQNIIHTRQAILSLGSHIPAMAANLQQALGVTGSKLHEMFKAGGLPLDTWTKVSKILEKRYSNGLAEATNHSTLNIIALQNALTRLQQTVYENGFDSGFTTFLKTLQGGLNAVGIDDLGKKIGEAFRIGFTAASLFAQKVIELREPIAAVAKGLAGYAVASLGIRLAAGALALLTSPLGAAAAFAALLASQWDMLSSVFSGSDSSFNAAAENIKKLTNGWIDLHKSIKGAVEIWELAKGLFSGKSLDDSKSLAAQAGADFDAGKYGQHKGQDFAQGFLDKASELFSKLGTSFKIPSFDIGSLGKDWDRLYKESAPRDFASGGDYKGNAARYASLADNELSESLK
ncbi:tape measure protein [Methylocystis heyeri]|uniref:Tape measure protein N-terminal domain-containing protein n=1 Tax=Methylocystis heyeri TaxID=391905 RepID=A0A6B8KFI3_9HYPH|nr:tape measure protein [Methylocystis heyeri]QGM46477.1 hypothetical protein H2LOC_012665 [Methylocystis heyeri]